MNKIYFATGNKGKAQEAQHILGVDIEIADLELDEIQELDIEKIVRHKVQQAYEKLKSPVFVDDVSVEVEIWNGFPGPFIKYLHKAGGNEQILYMMRNEKNRRAKVIATIGYHDGMEIHIFEGIVNCEITNEERGDKGWGLDPILQPVGLSETYSEMSVEQKNSLSHRRLAMNKFKEYLNSQKEKQAI